MSNQIIVYKRRRNILHVSLGFDVSSDTFVSEIRSDKIQESDLIATWDVSFANDGADGELVFTLDTRIAANITRSKGYMSFVRISNGRQVPVFHEPIEVVFQT